MQQIGQKLTGSQVGKRTEKRRKRLISLLECYTEMTGLCPNLELGYMKGQPGRLQLSPSAASKEPQGTDTDPRGERPHAPALAGQGWHGSWHNSMTTKKTLKRISFCTTSKKRKLILILQLYSPSIADKIPSDLFQPHKTQLLL